MQRHKLLCISYLMLLLSRVMEGKTPTQHGTPHYWRSCMWTPFAPSHDEGPRVWWPVLSAKTRLDALWRQPDGCIISSIAFHIRRTQLLPLYHDFRCLALLTVSRFGSLLPHLSCSLNAAHVPRWWVNNPVLH